MGRVAVMIILTGIGWYVAGSAFRALHWPFADVLLIIACCCLGTGSAALMIAAIRNRGLSGLLDPPERQDESGFAPPS